MTRLSAIQAVAFDAYGTLLDVYSVTQCIERYFPGKGPAFADLWRGKQLEYTWLRTLGNRYKPFWEVTCDALDFTAGALEVELPQPVRAELLDQYERLAPFPENRHALEALKRYGMPLAVLSNGNREMLSTCLERSDLAEYFDHVLSVDGVEKFKPCPEVYALATEAFDLPAANILFVSSNGWDIAGASWFGFTTFWLNRSRQTVEALGVEPAASGALLTDIVAFLDSGR